MRNCCRRERLTTASDKLLQASKAWFYNALLGNGKFHDDPHAGNLMINNEHIGFIDFGNLYQLKRDREDGVNELHKDAGSPNRIIDAIKQDAQQAGGDKDYAIDIGV